MITPSSRNSLRFALVLLWAFAGPGIVDVWSGSGASVAEAQDQRPQKKKKKRTKKARKKKQGRTERRGRARGRDKARAEPRAQDKKKKERDAAAEDARAAQESAVEGDSEIVREGEKEVKVMRFTGLDVEGRLKSPMLLYFTNRVRAEFDRPSLPHRSFMPELQRSTRGEELK